MKIDLSVYPDLKDPPVELNTAEDRADYLHRICAQWDYGIIPQTETIAGLSGWRDIFDRYPLPQSAAYHTFRYLFGWPARSGFCLRAAYEIDDLNEGRSDPCARWV